ncbi:hypothetical protein CRYUN_Cryun03dG0176600 [Craigia yunnanensis]
MSPMCITPCTPILTGRMLHSRASPSIVLFFKDSSVEERQHAEKLMDYQNKRGGKVMLQSMLMPLSEFDHAEKGDALYAMELALSLEKLNNEKLLNLHKMANKVNDVHSVDFIETEFLTGQVESIRKPSEYVAQLRRVGRGHGNISDEVIYIKHIKMVFGTLIRYSSMIRRVHDEELQNKL